MKLRNDKYYHKINNLDIALEETDHKYIMINQWAKDFSYKWDLIRNSNIKFTLVKSTNNKQALNKNLVDKLLNNN